MFHALPAAGAAATRVRRAALVAVLAGLLCAPSAMAAGPTSTLLNCTPAATIVGESTTCLVVVTDIGGPPAMIPTGSVNFSSTGAGAFPGGAMCSLNGAGMCTNVTYRPAAAGTHTLKATYAGGPFNDASEATTAVTVSKRAARVAIDCPVFVEIGKQGTCSATVSDDSLPGEEGTPTGMVSFTSSLAGTFDAASCTLVARTCSVGFTPSAPGTHGIKATYGGDAVFRDTFALGGLAVVSRTASAGFTMTCAPTDPAAGSPTTCTAVVADPKDIAAVTFKSTGAGTFSATTCAPVAGKCSVTYTPTQAGAQTVSASVFALARGMLSAASDLTVRAASATPSGPATTTGPGLGAAATPALPAALRLTAKATRKRARKALNVKVTGKLTVPPAVGRRGCTGAVRVVITSRKKTVASRSVKLTSGCAYGTTIRLADRRKLARKLSVRVSFPGNAAVGPPANAPKPLSVKT